jgi:catechol 2,3-dioxygenase-like lactoylglutathione lyase family enzyme
MPLSLLGVVHVNVNCSDLERSLRFYADGLGLAAQSHTRPAPQDGAGFGLSGRVQWDAHLLHDGRGFAGPAVDLLEWQQPPPVGQPWPEPSHLGFSRLGFVTPDLSDDDARLRASGAEGVSPPPRGPGPAASARRALYRDPDGVFIELSERAAGGRELHHVSVNCADLARSRDWYERVLGLERAGSGGHEIADGRFFGLPGEVAWEAARLHVSGQPGRFAIELIEWRQPRHTGSAYASAHHLGIYRMAFLVDDAHAWHERLRALGVQCMPPVWLDMGPEIPIDGLYALFFRDPDGSCLELIQTPVMRS